MLVSKVEAVESLENTKGRKKKIKKAHMALLQDLTVVGGKFYHMPFETFPRAHVSILY